MKNIFKFLFCFSLALSSLFSYGQTLFFQDFEGGTDDWNFIASPATYDVSNDTWALRTSLSTINPSSGTTFWGMRDLNNGNGGGAFDHTLTFDTVDVSMHIGVVISFNYHTIGYDASDDILYEVFEDGVGQGIVNLSKDNQHMDTVIYNVPNSVNEVYLVLTANQNGGSDYAGWDNVIISGTPSGPCTSTASSFNVTECSSYTLPSGNNTITTLGTQSVMDTITNSCGADSVMTINVTILPLNLGVTQNTDSLTSNQSGGTYQWIDCNNGNSIIVGETDSSFVATANGNYAVVVTFGACTDTSSCVNVSSFPSPQLVFTEIMYNPAEAGTDSSEFLEIYNNGPTAVNLAGYTLTGVTYTFPSVTLNAGNYIVITEDSSAMVSDFAYTGALVWIGSLSNGGESVVLKDNFGLTIDSVRYDDVSPFPTGADGGGASLVLCDPNLDNNDGNNWSLSTTNTGVTVNSLTVFGSPGALDNACSACAPTASSFSVTECSSYALPSGNNTITTVGTQTVMDTIPNSCGADSVMTINVTILQLNLNLTQNTDSLTSNQTGATYQWIDCSNGNSIIVGETDSSFVATTNGSYAVIVTLGACTDTSLCVNVNSFPSPQLVFTEIMYNPAEAGTDSSEFIEIYNNGPTAVNLAGYTLTGVTYTFPSVTLNAGNYIVITEDSSAMVSDFAYTGAHVWSGSLSNSGESVVLKDNFGFLIDSVKYDDASPFPTGADGGGASLVLCDPNLDNNDGNNWSLSTTNTGVTVNSLTVFGSPGASDSACVPCAPTTSSFSVTECSSYALPSGNSTITTAGSQSVMDTILNSCGADSVMTINVTILLSTPLIGSVANTICNGDSVVINGITYNAANPTGTEVMTAANGCDSTVTVNITVGAAITGSVTDALCDGGSIVINATTYDASNLTGTEVMTAANGCDSTVTVNITVGAAITGSVTDALCDGGSIVVNSTTYNASNLTGTEVMTAANGCDSTVTVNITVAPAIDITTTTSGFDITANATSATYQWIDCNNGNALISGATNATYTATVNGDYAVVVTMGSCSDTSACVNINTVGVDNINGLLSGAEIYPNPTTGNVTITNNEIAITSIRIVTITGEEVYSLKNINKKQLQISLANFSKGIYFVKVQSNNQQKIIKLIKQ